MKKLFLFVALVVAFPTFGQLSMGGYLVKVQTGQPYSPLTTGTNISSGLIWDDENFKIPMGFSTDIGGLPTSNFSFSAGWGFAPGTDTMGVVNTFVAFGSLDLQDRGAISGSAKSPLRYLVSGVSPNRIFKFEMFNAGFFDEGDIYGTMSDSTNIQVWVYETSKIVEVRFGDSKISNPDDYFLLGASPLVGYVSDFDLAAETFSKGYFLTGNPTSPIVDSATSLFDIENSMFDYPESGTVYRFIPKTVAASIGESNLANQFQVYPTITTDYISVIAENTASTSGRIMDMNGKVVSLIESIENGKNTIYLSHLASGNYVLEIAHNDGKALYKITKQ